jgi:hypothetical protein
MATLTNLKAFYGGGYEIATVLDQKFAKLNDVTYLFWRADRDSKGVRIGRLPVRACRYSYHNDMLVIRSAKFEDKGEERAIEQNLFYVSPVYREPHPGELASITPPSLNARFLCNYFLVPVPPNEIAILGMLCSKETADEKKWVTFTETPTEVMAAVEVEFITAVAKEIAKNNRLSQ